MFGLCRHPMYAGVLLALWGLLLSEPFELTVFVVTLLSASFVLEASHEERVMLRDFGDYYSRYQAAVPFLVPYGFLRPKPVTDANPVVAAGKSAGKKKNARPRQR
jgi:protein-S-isoprenylcysteine O-methyltransferase Ste14